MSLREPQRLFGSDESPSILRDALSAEKADRGPDSAHLRRMEQRFAERMAAEGSSASSPGVAARKGLSWFGQNGSWLLFACVGIVSVATFAPGGFASSESVPGFAGPTTPTTPRTVNELAPQKAKALATSMNVASVRDVSREDENTKAAPATSIPVSALANVSNVSGGVKKAPGKANSVTTSAPDESDDTEEIALLARAHEALRAHPSESLALCQQHRVQFAQAHFAQEREAVAIEALVYLHRTQEAEQRWNEFKARYPTSSHRIHLEDLFSTATTKSR
ncbi:hypothetical protein AKJ09_03098 [Labilithrix luteola]|uniref:Uncharacterized protein n=1 Tax=Labilithrix luteola TaxID=1391654 RepID=A0A0K1PTH5_9BACT|nr:hypothetical protein [Labilithrix luteola]AKU96434.1 hypothetical protein AKJ09_03098 [Labilithrix luteola]